MIKKCEIEKYEVLLGWTCNQRCMFCSVGHKLKEPKIKSLEETKRSIERAKELGIREISFSGGEPTIIPYLTDAIKYADKLGFEKIEIQTNGKMFYYEKFAKKILGAGVNDFIFSIIADEAKLHNFLVMSSNAFEQSIKGLLNVKKLIGNNDIAISTNTVITSYNYKVLPRIMNFLLQLDLDGHYLIPVVIDGSAYDNKNTLVPKLSAIAPFVQRSIDLAVEKNKKITIHNFPYCLMQGYEDAIADLDFDTILDSPDYKISLLQNSQKFRIKTEKCEQCKYFKVCLGAFKRYVKMFGFGEFIPIKGKKVRNIR